MIMFDNLPWCNMILEVSLNISRYCYNLQVQSSEAKRNKYISLKKSYTQ